jgi:hypothetical protein
MASKLGFQGRFLHIITALFAKVGLEVESEVAEMFEKDRRDQKDRNQGLKD